MLDKTSPSGSLRVWVLISFCIALVPLVVLLVQSQRALAMLSDLATSEARRALARDQQLLMMEQLTLSMTRELKQGWILDDYELMRDARRDLWRYKTELGRLCEQEPGLTPWCDKLQQLLPNIVTLSRQVKMPEDTDALTELRSLHQTLLGQSRTQTQNRLNGVERRVALLHRDLAWQSVTLALLTLLGILWAASRISRPVRQLDAMIRTIGRDGERSDFPPVHGPAELVRLGERLNWLSARLGQLEVQRHTLLRHASHELKTPLASIREGVQLLGDGVVGALSAQQQQIVTLISDSSLRLQQGLEQWLDYNRFQQLPAATLQVLETQEIIGDIREAQALALQKADMKLDVQSSVAQLYSDVTLLKRTLDNLISNACAYGKPGSTVLLRIFKQQQDVVIDVANHGDPVPESLRRRLFEPFVRGDNKGKRRIAGSGLGLSIVADCVRLLQGQISLVPLPHYDTCFRVRLPQIEEA